MIICFDGIDGSGKSLQAGRLVDRLNAEGYPAAYVWTGGDSPVTAPLIRLGQRLLKAPTTKRSTWAPPADRGAQYRAYLASMQRIFRRRLVRRLWEQVSLIEHTGEIWAAVLPQLLRKRIVVCDRYIYDTIVGIAVLAGVGADELAHMLQIPKPYRLLLPDKWFLLDVPAEVAFRRKDDIPDPLFLERRVPLYHIAAGRIGMQVIDGTRPPDEIAAIVWQSVQRLLPGARAAVRTV